MGLRSTQQIGSLAGETTFRSKSKTFSLETLENSHLPPPSLRDPDTGDIVPGAVGDHLLGWQYAGYVTEEDTFVEDGALVLRNQKRSFEGQSPAGQFDYTSGWVMSMHKVHFNKGYMEIRAQFPTGDKAWETEHFASVST